MCYIGSAVHFRKNIDRLNQSLKTRCCNPTEEFPMAYRSFEDVTLSRRALFRSGALFAGGAAVAASPIGAGVAWADHHKAAGAAMWPNVAATVADYVSTGKVANMQAVLGFGQADPVVISDGLTQFATGTPVDGDTLYRIYSQTKPITGMATMMLIDDGLIGLDQPLAEIIPAFAETKVQIEYDGSIEEDNLEPQARPVTIRHLLTHTSGLGYGIVQKGPIAAAYAARGLGAGQVTKLPLPGIGGVPEKITLETFANRLASLPLVHQPGTKWSYSVGLDVLGRVIEVASGMSFDSFLRTRLFEPAGMDSTFFRVPDSEKDRLTTNYGINGGSPLPLDLAADSIFLDEPAFPYGGSGLVSSPRDYDRFLRMLLGNGMLDGKRVMGELAVRVGTSNLLPRGVETAGTWIEGQGFGAGGRVQTDNGMHAYGWGGAAGTVGFVEYTSGLRAGLYTQYMPAEAYPIQRGYPEIVLRDLSAMRGM